MTRIWVRGKGKRGGPPPDCKLLYSPSFLYSFLPLLYSSPRPLFGLWCLLRSILVLPLFLEMQSRKQRETEDKWFLIPTWRVHCRQPSKPLTGCVSRLLFIQIDGFREGSVALLPRHVTVFSTITWITFLDLKKHTTFLRGLNCLKPHLWADIATTATGIMEEKRKPS